MENEKQRETKAASDSNDGLGRENEKRNMDNSTISLSKKFVAGFLTCSAVRSLQQDYWGMEGTIRHVVNDWVSWRITVPLAILLLIVALWLCVNPKKDEAV